MVKGGGLKLGVGIQGKKGQVEKVSETRQLHQLEIGDRFKKYSQSWDRWKRRTQTLGVRIVNSNPLQYPRCC